jgi:pyruvate dehydrogenase (quinone)
LLEKNNPNAVGMTGLLGWGAAVHAVLDCDVLVMWGTDFPFRDFLPQRGRVIQVDTHAAALGRRTPLAMGIHADAGAVARALLPLIQSDHPDDFLRAMLSFNAREVAAISHPLRVVDEEAPLRPELLTRLVSDHSEPDAVFTVDTGTPDIWCARYLQALDSRRILGSFNYGSMGCALAMAIGAKSLYPRRQVIAMCGDGGISMLAGDLLTLLQEGLAVKVLVYNNSELDYVALEQIKAGMRKPMGTHLRSTNFAAVAQAMGLQSWRISRVNEAIPAIKAWLAADGPALLDAAVDRHALPLPPGLVFMQGLGYCKGLGEQSSHAALDGVKRLLFGNRRFFA